MLVIRIFNEFKNNSLIAKVIKIFENMKAQHEAHRKWWLPAIG